MADDVASRLILARHSVNNTSMPIMHTSPAARQRMALVVFFMVIGTLVWWQEAGNHTYSVQTFFKTPAPDVVDTLDFTRAEAAWSNLKIDAQGNLIIDELTETALLDAIAILHDPPSQPSMARMALLLEKQFGAIASRQIMQLLPMLKDYKEAERRWWEKNGRSIPPPYTELFRLQDELLGETLAKKLFSEQRRLIKTMLGGQQTRNHTRITQTEPTQASMDSYTTPREKGAQVE